MNTLNFVSLINLLGFAVGIALYAMLALMVVRVRQNPETQRFSFKGIDLLLLVTSVLGLLWNIGELFAFGIHDFGKIDFPPFLLAISYSALGFLPAVVVHSTLRNSENKRPDWLKFSAYSLSIAASLLHFYNAVFFGNAPSILALQILAFGFLVVLIALFFLNFRETVRQKAIWASALVIFAPMALHLANHNDANADNFIVEFLGHQASLPIVLAILYQDYRFAFADLFLKRGLALLLVSLAAFGVYFLVASPLLALHETHEKFDANAIATIIACWVGTALVYPLLQNASGWFVDKILLRRADYKILQKELAQVIEKQEDTSTILDFIAVKLGLILTAQETNWRETERQTNTSAETFFGNNHSVFVTNEFAEIFIPTTESPSFLIELRNFIGGRRLLSDEIEMLENVSLIAARRIDALRVSHERCEQEIREQEFSKLATEAELRALRAQLNPHFLFNALTTIGYLIKTSPEKAMSTLMQLTKLLRGVLRSTGEFSTLGEELNLIEAYLEIEHARFEERLTVEIKVSPELLRLKIPSLILQPIVENAVKHGISNAKKGGAVKISARLAGEILQIEIADTGAGVNEAEILDKRKSQVGLNNVEARLSSHFGKKSSLQIESNSGRGTKVTIEIPVKNAQPIVENTRLNA